jgi:hypothetical protein
MRHVFTAGWIDDSADICELAADTFSAWIFTKYHNSRSRPDVCSHTFDSPERSRFRASLVETLADGRHQRTTFTATSHPYDGEDLPSGWITVDIHRSGEVNDEYIPSPWLVQELIRMGVRPRFAHDTLTVSPRVLRGGDSGETLAELVTDFHRRIALVVLSEIPDLFAQLRGEPGTLADVAAEAACSAAGLARVVLADQACLAQYNAAVGPGHAVAEGGLRLFRAGADPAIPGDAGRHPQWAPQSWYHEPVAAMNLVGRIVVADAVAAARTAKCAAVFPKSRVAAGGQPAAGWRTDGHAQVAGLPPNEQSGPFNRP